MSKVQMIQATIAPKAKAVASDVIKMSKSSAVAKEASASAAEAMDAQGKAMVNMQKKAYVKPEMKTVDVETEKTILSGSSYGDRTPDDDFGFDDWDY